MILSDLATVTGPGARRDRGVFYGLTVVSTFLQAAAILTLVPILSRLTGDDPAAAWPWVGLLVAELVLAWVCDHVATHAGLRVGLAVMRAVEDLGLSSVAHLDPADLHSEKASKLRDLVAKAGTESVSVVVLLVSPLIHAMLSTPILALLLLTVAWQLTVVALVGGVALFAALMASRRAVAKSEEAYADATRELDDAALEFAWAQPTLRSAGVGMRTMDGVLRQARRSGMRLLAWQIPGETLFSVVLQLTLLAFGVVTGLLYLDGVLSGAAAATMIVVLLRIVESTGSLALLSTPTTAASRTLADLADLAREALREPVVGAVVPEATARATAPEIVLEGVGFTYPDGTRALTDIDLRLRAGEITVIVGGSGSGKSTLLDVLAGLREPATGTVVIDGSAVPAAERRRRSSVMFQRTDLKAGTLRENVVVSDRGLPEERLAEIARQTSLDEVLAALPKGWDTRVGEGGNALSGGERQRTGLARALVKTSGLLLVDEATSALDALTERAVVDALDAARGDRTTVIVTHRPALVALADSVIVLSDGRVIDAGDIDGLLARGGEFADLWQRWRDSESWQV